MMKTKKKTKKFTWADLKEAVNKIPDEHLKGEVFMWTEGGGGKVTLIDDLEEDYLNEPEEGGCAPKSSFLGDITKDNYLVLKKGTPIVWCDHVTMMD